jgi:DNA-binding NarL/FixJ family response regulator
MGWYGFYIILTDLTFSIMIFLVSKDPFNAMQLQNQLKLTGESYVEIFVSVEEVERNLYKLPDMVLMDENLSLSNLLYLTRSVKIYDTHTQIIWLCQKECNDLQKVCKSYGVAYCIPKNKVLLEDMAAKIHEILGELNSQRSSNKRMEYLKKNLLDMDS